MEITIHDTSGDEHLGVNRKVQYKEADVFMICVACNDRASFDSISKWRSEIQSEVQNAPIILILTKSDLEDAIDEPVKFEELKEVYEAESYQAAMKTSSKEWEDFNVHKAFNKTLTIAYLNKYE